MDFYTGTSSYRVELFGYHLDRSIKVQKNASKHDGIHLTVKYYSLMVPPKKTNKISQAILFLKLTHVVCAAKLSTFSHNMLIDLQQLNCLLRYSQSTNTCDHFKISSSLIHCICFLNLQTLKECSYLF